MNGGGGNSSHPPPHPPPPVATKGIPVDEDPYPGIPPGTSFSYHPISGLLLAAGFIVVGAVLGGIVVALVLALGGTQHHAPDPGVRPTSTVTPHPAPGPTYGK